MAYENNTVAFRAYNFVPSVSNSSAFPRGERSGTPWQLVHEEFRRETAYTVCYHDVHNVKVKPGATWGGEGWGGLLYFSLHFPPPTQRDISCKCVRFTMYNDDDNKSDLK